MSAPTLEARVGGWAGLLVAIWFPVFGAFFFGGLGTGFDLSRLGDPDYALTELRGLAGLIRILGVGNGVSMLCAALFALALARSGGTPSQVFLAATLTFVGWLVYFIGEISDQTAYVALPFVYELHPGSARTSFITLQGFGRMAHAWGYFAIGLGTLGLAVGLRRGGTLPRGLGRVGAIAGASGILLFAVEFFLTSRTGDAGAGMMGIFSALLVIWGGANVVWHGWAGRRLLQR